jgi:hypothetical protein
MVASFARTMCLATRGLRATMARKAAVRSQATAIHKMGIEEPVSSRIFAAPRSLPGVARPG